MFASSYVIYAGAFTADFRQRLSEQWLGLIQKLNIKTSQKQSDQLLKVTDVLSDQVTLMNYVN